MSNRTAYVYTTLTRSERVQKTSMTVKTVVILYWITFWHGNLYFSL